MLHSGRVALELGVVSGGRVVVLLRVALVLGSGVGVPLLISPNPNDISKGAIRKTDKEMLADTVPDLAKNKKSEITHTKGLSPEEEQPRAPPEAERAESPAKPPPVRTGFRNR
mmetsp:Transcript_129341/g.414617  ORF Transcript_129341/g.414617 Transcript_129341/m.414617 type:complete len:113 (+) Transcript_129341:1302-1640(+)